MTEKIKLIVTVLINYQNKKERPEAIKIAKRSVLSCSTLGSVGAIPKSARTIK